MVLVGEVDLFSDQWLVVSSKCFRLLCNVFVFKVLLFNNYIINILNIYKKGQFWFILMVSGLQLEVSGYSVLVFKVFYY